MDPVRQLILALHAIGAIKFGEFTLKSGRKSPVYVDLRGLVSHPTELQLAAQALSDVLSELEFDLVAGLPYAGLPLAVAVSLVGGHPAVYSRKEVKEYGTKKRVEGDFEPGQIVVALDDVITDGGAKLELVEPLEADGLVVRDFVVLVDREQGGREALAAKGYSLHSVTTLRHAVTVLYEAGEIDENRYTEVMTYLDQP